MATPRNPALIVNRCTCWEVALHRDGKAIERLAFTARRTRRALFDIMRDNGPRILAMLQRPDDDEPILYRKGQWHIGEGLSVGFTGYTERDCFHMDNRSEAA
jgi:hypothetical protein